MKEFKLIIAGGRDFTDSKKMHAAIDQLANHGELKEYAVSIVTGMARGADMLGREFALAFNVKRYEFPADWNQYGKRAGFIRNKQMGDFADGLLAFWDGESRGTAHMIETMRALEKPVKIVLYKSC